MKLQDQVCTLVQAKRLKELGVKQESYFYWQHYPEMVYKRETMAVIPPISKEGITDPGEFWSAYNVAELGIMLPWRLHDKFYFECFPWDVTDLYETEAECRAAMLIYLLENNRITAEEINARL